MPSTRSHSSSRPLNLQTATSNTTERKTKQMQPPPLDPASSANPGRHYSVTLATIAAVCAILAVPFGFVPFAGLAASMLVLGLIGVLTPRDVPETRVHRNGHRISGCVHWGDFILSVPRRNHPIEGRCQWETGGAGSAQLQAMQAQANSSSDRKVWGDLIKVLGGNDVSDDQAKFWGGLVDLGIRAWQDSSESDPGNK